VKIYEALENQMAPQKVAYKLISMILEIGVISAQGTGIGLSQEEVERLMEMSGIGEKPKKSNGRKRRSSGGGNRRRSSGGGRRY